MSVCLHVYLFICLSAGLDGKSTELICRELGGVMGHGPGLDLLNFDEDSCFVLF